MLADPHLYDRDKETFARATERIGQVDAEERALFARWEQAEQRLEELEAIPE